MGRCNPDVRLEERHKIAKWHEANMPVSEIADRLDRAPSTIHHKLKRNHDDDKELPELNRYCAIPAQNMFTSAGHSSKDDRESELEGRHRRAPEGWLPPCDSPAPDLDRLAGSCRSAPENS